VLFGGDGIEPSAARSDHQHMSETWAGGTLNITTTAGRALDVTNQSGAHAIVAADFGVSLAYGLVGSPDGGTISLLAGLDRVGVYGSALNADEFAVVAFSQKGTGVFSRSDSQSHFAVEALNSSGIAIWGESFGSDAVVGKAHASAAGIVGIGPNGAGSNYGGYFQGNVFVEGTITPASDARLKSNIAPFGAGIDAVMRLQPVTYAWAADPEGNVHLGFIAQDVQQVLPELVSEGRDGNLGLNYDGLIPVLSRAIQELQAQIDALSSGQPTAAAPRHTGGDSWAIALAFGVPLLALSWRNRPNAES
jgi:hypothetical protein